MVLALGPKFRIPTQIFKCQSDLCEVVSVLYERQVAHKARRVPVTSVSCYASFSTWILNMADTIGGLL